MVSSQKIFLLSFIGMMGLIVHGAPERAETESFLAEKPRKSARGGMSKARSEAVVGLEALAHGLADEIEAITGLMHDIMWSTRGVAEGNVKNPFTNSLYKDKESALKKLKEAQQATQLRIKDLKRLAQEIKR